MKLTAEQKACNDDYIRYGKVTKKYPREILMLVGVGCVWGKCTFCDYHLDRNVSVIKNFNINKKAIDMLTGEFKCVQVIDSGSTFELDFMTMIYLRDRCAKLGIEEIIFENHALYGQYRYMLDEVFGEVDIRIKSIVGAESLLPEFRDKYFNKGYGNVTANQLSMEFEWVNILIGFKGDSLTRITTDASLALGYFERVTFNVFSPNSTSFERDDELIDKFYKSDLFANLKILDRVEILDDLDPRCEHSFDNVGAKTWQINLEK